ncbi:hypothetical protein IQ277_28020 [Nostocales cyanobacterium LEGE 12452]|nr:hypothetical protein [Nostocales cyanobacterium LEGE 12452]
MTVTFECNNNDHIDLNYLNIGGLINREIEGNRNDLQFSKRIAILEDYLNGREDREGLLKNAFEQGTQLHYSFVQNLHKGDMISPRCFYPRNHVGEAILSFFEPEDPYCFFVFQKWYHSITHVELFLVMVHKTDGWENEFEQLMTHGVDFRFEH